MAIEDLWESPAQCAVMTFLCWKHREDVDCADPSATQVARFAGVEKRRVLRVYGELEAMEAIARLAPLHPGGRQRFAITLDRALAKWRRGVSQETGGGVAGITGGGDPGIRGGVIPGTGGGVAGDTPGADRSSRRTNVQDSKKPAAAPRLPLLGSLHPDHPPHVTAAMERTRAQRQHRLRERVTGIARSLLMNPAAARELLNGESIDDHISALVEATRRACASKLTRDANLRDYNDVVHGICVSELFKHRNPNVITGQAPRPRDLRRQR